ncbi:hypothetical protein LTR85_010502 [Meristemomyces frigidus]|nr:hypothetical protein LTR85_010502 [Meristemomyces frigidus]
MASVDSGEDEWLVTSLGTMVVNDEAQQGRLRGAQPLSIDAVTTTATELKLPAKASLMGLAVETRLQVYGNLLTPTLTNAETRKLADHCCNKDYASRLVEALDGYRSEGIACACAGHHVQVQILRTSKQIFDEAMPVLYEKMELRLPIPDDLVDSGIDVLSKLFTTMVPYYALQHISRVVITGRLFDALAAPDEDHSQCASIEHYCAILRQKLPNLKHVRLHMDDDGYATMSLLKPFDHIAILPLLQSVTIRLHVREPHLKYRMQLKHAVQSSIAHGLRHQAESMGRILVIAEL